MYYAFLGHSQALSELELNSLGIATTPVAPHLVLCQSDPEPIAWRLGGTVKLATEVGRASPALVTAELARLMAADNAKNVAVSNYTDIPLSSGDLYQLKSSVARPLRFVSMETRGHELVMLRRQHVAEFNLIKGTGSEIVIAKTTWIQDGVDWARRDRDRPYQDIKRGMLPPKLARLMVNLADRGGEGTVVDPFCGAGTILQEASLLGHPVIGSDIDAVAVEGTRVNLAWLASKYQLALPAPRVGVSDATHLSNQVASADFLVTEPYLGPLLDARSLPAYDKLKNIARGLDKLYRGALSNWRDLGLTRLVMVIPEYHLGSTLSTLRVATIASLGYTVTAQVPYSQPGAVVVRNITVLERPSTNN